MAAFLLMYAVLDVSTAHAVTVNQFYPFGSDSGDTLLSEPVLSTITDPLQLPFELPILTTTTTASYQVSVFNF